jgi:hypothetical protein
MRGARRADATLGSGLDVTSNEWARLAEARNVRAGGEDPPCNPMPPHFRSSLSCSGRAPKYMKTESLTGRGGSASPKRTHLCRVPPTNN